MIRTALCSLVLLGYATVARADELDNETGPAKNTPPAVTAPAANAPAGSELDRESPDAAHYWRGGWGYGPRFYGGFYRPVGFYGYRPAFYPRFHGGFYPGFYGGFYPGFYGFSYSGFYGYAPVYPAFYGFAYYW
jgi:hypothetical protein